MPPSLPQLGAERHLAEGAGTSATTSLSTGSPQIRPYWAYMHDMRILTAAPGWLQNGMSQPPIVNRKGQEEERRRQSWTNSMIANITITTMRTTTDAAAMIGLT